MYTVTWWGPWCSGYSCLPGLSEIAGSNPTLVLKLQNSKMFLPCPVITIKYCGEPPWPRESELGLRQSGFGFRIYCLEGSVISSISPSSEKSPGPVWPLCAQSWPKTHSLLSDVINLSILTTLNYIATNHINQPFEHLCYGLSAIIQFFTIKALGSTLDLRIWRLQTTDSDD